MVTLFLSSGLMSADLIISPDRGQFQCPLCNKIGNFLLPIHNFERNEGLGEATGEVNWTDWILTDTERGTKRELSEESASREDIMDALNQEELGQEDDEDEEEDGKMGETSTPRYAFS